MTRNKWTVASYIAETIARTGTGRLYGIIGTSVLEFIDTLIEYKNKITYISTRHEQVAASAADAEARLTGKPGYTVVHAGPGFLNTLISLGIAYRDRSPLFVLSGGVKRRLYKTGAWLEVDQQKLAEPVTVDHARLNDPRDLPALLRRLLANALKAPTGPVHLEVPEELWHEPLPNDTIEPPVLEELLAPPKEPENEDIEESLDIIQDSEKPLILVSREANKPGAWETIEKLAEKLDAYIVFTGNGRGACNELNPRCLGRVGFGGGSLPADKALEEADLVISLGGELDDITTYGYVMMPRGDVIIASMDPLVDKRPLLPSLAVKADPLAYARRLLEKLEKEDVRKDNSGWREQVEEYKARWQSILEEAVKRTYQGRVNPNRFFQELGRRLPPDRTILTAGQGTHIVYTYNYLRLKPPSMFLAATNLGAMGFALPAALGAALARPDYTVVGVLGDGEIMMTLQDLETIGRVRAPVKIIVVNDDSYRVLLLRQTIQKQGRVIGTLHGNPSFEKIAREMGVEAATVTSDSEIGDGVGMLLDSEGPFLLEVKIPREDLPPLNLDMTLRMS